MGGTGTRTLVFTDLVASTELLGRLGDEGADRLRRTHFGLLRGAAAETGGEEIKNLGDGLMLAFPSAVDAVRCAVRIQEAVSRHSSEHPDQALEVRVGIHSGEPVHDEGDLFGSAVVVASRLCGQARGGQILANELVADLVGSRGGFHFRRIGPLTLKGLAQPLAAVAVDWGAGHPSTSIPAGRGRFSSPRGPALVGRGHELALLETELVRARAGEFRIVLLLADPGVGKTRLVRELLARNETEVLGLTARAHPLGETTSFGLWAEALAQYHRRP